MKKFILLLFFPCLIFAATPVQQLQNNLSHIKSLSAKFTQTIKGDDGSVMQKSSGQLDILKPGKFRWETFTPMKQLIVCNGKNVWIYEPDLEQVTVKPLNNSLSETPILLLTNKTDLSSRFLVKRN